MGEVRQLPLFEGFRPEGTEIRLTGATGGRRETYAVRQTAYFLVRARCKGVSHDEKGRERVLVRSHKFEVLGAERVDAEGMVADAIVAEAYDYLASIEDEEPEGDEGDDEAQSA